MEDNFGNNNVNHGKGGPLSKVSPIIFIFISLATVFFLYQIIGGSILYLLGVDSEINNDNLVMTRIVMTFAQFMFILAPAVLLAMLQENKIKETFRLKMPKIQILIFSVIGILVIQPFLQVYLYYQNELIFSLPFGKEIINQLKELFDMMESMTAKLVEANSFPEFILVVIFIAVTPAICEEFLFRGLVFRNFEKIIPASKAIFFTGFLFALFHFHPFNIIPLMILGIFLTFIVYHSGSIYTAVICHFINNFISAFALYWFGTESIDSKKLSGDEQIQFVILGIASLFIFIGIIFLIKKYSVLHDDKHKNIDGLTNLQSADE
ncbi:MAG: CPBP family intramembrane glutamic endopeptidase [Ignavibacteria bacterium]